MLAVEEIHTEVPERSTFQLTTMATLRDGEEVVTEEQ